MTVKTRVCSIVNRLKATLLTHAQIDYVNQHHQAAQAGFQQRVCQWHFDNVAHGRRFHCLVFAERLAFC